MVLSSLVITLAADPLARAHALATLAVDRRLLIGAPARNRLPVVAEAASAAEGAAMCEALSACDGVVCVDVVAIDFLEDA